MKIPNRLLSETARDNLLHQFYKNKNFLVFVHGEEYFNEQVERVFGLWLSGPNQETWGNNLIIDRTCWEYDNGYLD